MGLRIKTTAERTTSNHGLRRRYLRPRLRRCSNEDKQPPRSCRRAPGIAHHRGSAQGKRALAPRPRKPVHSRRPKTRRARCHHQASGHHKAGAEFHSRTNRPPQAATVQRNPETVGAGIKPPPGLRGSASKHCAPTERRREKDAGGRDYKTNRQKSTSPLRKRRFSIRG